MRKVAVLLLLAAAAVSAEICLTPEHDEMYHPIPLPQAADTLWRTTTALYENWASGGWQNGTYADYSYNDDDLLHRIVYQTWSGASWSNYMRYTYSYDTQGRNTQVLIEQWDGSWKNHQLTLNTYGGEQLLEALTQTWSGSGWTNYTLSTYTYQSGQVHQILYQSWSGNTWENSFLYTYSYESGLVREILAQNWSSGSWVNSTLYEYTYTGNLIHQIQTSTWTGGTWANSSLANHTYAGVLLSEILYQSWEGGAWQNYLHQDYTYDAHGNNTMILSMTWSGGSWENSNRITYTWESYMGLEEVTPEGDVSVLGPYPNPSRERVALDITLARPGNVRISMFDMAGRRLITLFDSPLQAGTHHLALGVDLPPGVYLARVEPAGESAVGRIVVLM